MRFSTISLCISICISTIDAFGVLSPIQHNEAFARNKNFPDVHSRGSLTKVDMGVVNPPPSETTGIKAVVSKRKYKR